MTSSSRTSNEDNRVLSVVPRGMRTTVLENGCDDDHGKSMNKKLSKLLINVTFQRSFGVVHVVISPGKTVSDLIKAAVDIYVREKRRPLLLPEPVDTLRFELHYSQFTFECLNPDQKVMNMASRNCFLCPKADTGSSPFYNFDEERKMDTASTDSSFSLTKLIDHLLF